MTFIAIIICVLVIAIIIYCINDYSRKSDNQEFEKSMSNFKADKSFQTKTWHIGMLYNKERKEARIINYDNKKYKDIKCKELDEVIMFDHSLVFLDKGSDIITFATLEKNRDLDIMRINDFSTDNIIRNKKHSEYYPYYPESLVAVSSSYKKICFLNNTEKPLEAKVVSFSDIISVEIIEDGTTTFSKSTTRTIGGALVGNVLMGGAGAVVGGLSGNSKKTEKVKTIAIKVLVRNIDEPAIVFTVYNWGETKTNGDKYKSYSDYAKKVKDIISVIIDSVDNEEKKAIKQKMPQQQTNVTDELMKLAKLKEDGLLTDAEFSNMKAKLLNRG